MASRAGSWYHGRMLGEFAAFIAAALAGAVALALGVLYYLKFRRAFLLHAALFLAALFLTSLRFCLRYVIDFRGAADPVLRFILWRGLYVPAAVLFFSQGLAWVHALAGRPLSRRSGAVLWIVSMILASINILAGSGPAGRILRNAADFLLMWASTAYVLAYCAANLRRLVKGPFSGPVVVSFAGALAFFMLSIPGWFGLVMPFTDYLLPVFLLFLSVVVVLIASRFFLQDSGGSGAAINRERALAFGLSARETEVAALALTGKSGKKIAEALFISPKTVETHISNIYRKTGAGSRFKLFDLIGGKGGQAG